MSGGGGSGRHILEYPPDGPVLADDRAITDLVGPAMYAGVDLVVVPVDRLDERFFTLETGFAGHLLQKFVNYRLRLALVGDISAHLARSTALRAFVDEADRGNQVWFAPDRAALDARLARDAHRAGD